MLQGLCPAGKWDAQTNHVEGVEQPVDGLGRIFRMVRRQNPLPVLDKYYPGAAELLGERGVHELVPITVYYPMERAAERLGFRPRCNFEQWLEELRAQPEERAEKSPPWP